MWINAPFFSSHDACAAILNIHYIEHLMYVAKHIYIGIKSADDNFSRQLLLLLGAAIKQLCTARYSYST